MARPRTYDQQQVLAAAMQCFWRNGYSATSMKDLERATGLAAGSLYNSFGSKDGLFEQVLEHYIDSVVCDRIERFLRAGDPLEGIEEYFLDCFRGRLSAPNMGCLLVNTATEMGPHHELVRRQVAQGLKRAAEGLRDALRRAQAAGQLPATMQPAQRASQLGLLLHGMLVSARVAGNQRWLTDAMIAVRGLLRQGSFET
jgi:TetR/AcrR family transcriptional repressor of nem operon